MGTLNKATRHRQPGPWSRTTIAWREWSAAGIVVAAGALPVTFAVAQTQAPSAGSELRPFRQAPAVPDRPSSTLQIPAAPKPAVRQAPGLKLEVKAFRITGLSVASEQAFLPALEQFLGPDRGFVDLERAARAVTDQLRADGYFLAQAYLPAQKVEDGIVEIAVLEGRIGQVKVEQKSEVPIQRSIIDGLLSALPPGTVIRDIDLERTLFLVGDLRGIKIESVLEPGEVPGTADLTVVVTATPRLQGSLTADNQGSAFTGEYRLGAGLDWNSPLERGDQLSLRLMRSVSNRLTFGRISYLTPLGPLGTKVGAAYSNLSYSLGTAQFKPLDAGGNATVGSLFVLHPLIRQRNLNLFTTLSHDRRTLFDEFKTLDLENLRSLDVDVLNLVGDSRDRWLSGGINTFSLSLTSGRVALRSALQKIIDTSSIGRRVEGNFQKLNFEYSRLQQFDAEGDYFGFVSISGQQGSKNLDSSEKMSLGGLEGVRAYADGEAASDSAVRLSVELRTPIAIPPSYNLPGYVIASLFFDAARGHINEQPLVTDLNNVRTLKGAGVGLRWGVPDNFLVLATMAFRLTSRGSGDPSDRKPRIFLSLSKSF